MRNKRGRLLARKTFRNLETQWATAAVASWIATFSPNVVAAPLGPRYIALGTGYPNLLTANQSSFESGTTGWAAVTNCSISQTSAQAWTGSKSLALVASAAGAMTAGTPTGTGGIRITQGDGTEAYSYQASAHFRAAVQGRTVTLNLLFYDSSGTLLSTTSDTTSGGGDATTGWVRHVAYAAAPATAAYAAIQVTVSGTTFLSETHYIDGVQLAYAPDGPQAWVAGGQTVTPTSGDTQLVQERAGARKQIDTSFSQTNIAALLHTYQLADPYGAFFEAGLFDADVQTASLGSFADHQSTSLTMAGGAPAAAFGQTAFIANYPLAPPAAPTFSGASGTGGHLVGGTSYYYIVVAQNALGHSTVGAEAVYTPPTTTATNQVTLTWAAVPGATGDYLVYRGTGSGVEQLLVDVGGGALTYTDSSSFVPSGALPTSDTSGGGGEYVTLSQAVAAGAGTWSLNDFTVRKHPSGAPVTVFNGNMWAHLAILATKASGQLMSVQWEITVTAT